MLTKPATNSDVATAVLEYFAGERREMLLIQAVALAIAAAAVGFLIATRTDFALAFMITVLIFGGAISAGIFSLMLRDRLALRALGLALKTEWRSTSIAEEKKRIAVVLSKYGYYRSGAAVLAVIGILGLTLSVRGWVHGAAAGLLLTASAQAVIDYYSERRAGIYSTRLAILT